MSSVIGSQNVIAVSAFPVSLSFAASSFRASKFMYGAGTLSLAINSSGAKGWNKRSPIIQGEKKKPEKRNKPKKTNKQKNKKKKKVRKKWNYGTSLSLVSNSSQPLKWKRSRTCPSSLQFHSSIFIFGRLLGLFVLFCAVFKKHQPRPRTTHPLQKRSLTLSFPSNPSFPLNAPCAGGLEVVWINKKRRRKDEHENKKSFSTFTSQISPLARPQSSPSLPSNLLLSIFCSPCGL